MRKKNGVFGFIVVNGRMLLPDRADIQNDSILTKGDFLTEAAMNCDEIPYGRSNCRFVGNPLESDEWKKVISRRIRKVKSGGVELIEGEVGLARVRERLKKHRST